MQRTRIGEKIRKNEWINNELSSCIKLSYFCLFFVDFSCLSFGEYMDKLLTQKENIWINNQPSSCTPLPWRWSACHSRGYRARKRERSAWSSEPSRAANNLVFSRIQQPEFIKNLIILRYLFIFSREYFSRDFGKATFDTHYCSECIEHVQILLEAHYFQTRNGYKYRKSQGKKRANLWHERVQIGDAHLVVLSGRVAAIVLGREHLRRIMKCFYGKK